MNEHTRADELSYLYTVIYAATFGLAHRCSEGVASYLEDACPGAKHFSFEYFVHCPLPLRPRNGRHRKGQAEMTLSLAPFLPRLAQDSLVTPKIEDDRIRYGPPTEHETGRHPFVVSLPQTALTRPLYEVNTATTPEELEAKQEEALKRLKDRYGVDVCWEECPVRLEDGHEVPQRFIRLEFNDCITLAKVLDGYEEQAETLAGADKVSKLRHYALLRSRLSSLLLPDPREVDVPIRSLVLPIQSDRLFYGLSWLWLIGKLGNPEEALRITCHIAKGLLGRFARSYVPAMAILHQHFIEHCVPDGRDEVQRKELLSRASLGEFTVDCPVDAGVASCTYSIPFAHCQESHYGIEKALFGFWERLGEAHEEMPDKEQECRRPLWLFRDYVVASERMTRLVRELCGASAGLKRTDNALVSCLIVGSPGSGKDAIAKILQRLSPRYWDGDTQYVNLAAIKPDPLAAPSLMGVSASMRVGNACGQTVSIDGLLGRIVSRGCKAVQGYLADHCENTGNGGNDDQKQEAFEELAKQCSRWPLVVLDELNSLGVESQGVLLRFLENAEVIPIGGLREEEDLPAVDAWKSPREGAEEFRECWDSLPQKLKTDCLIVAVINEDPEELTREKATDLLRSREILGGFLSELLYEQFIRIRRLRPDVKYRLKRNGYFTLPSLENRREDIPFLFVVHAGNALKAQGRERSDLWVTEAAMERLCDEKLTWPGNIRQLQDVAKRAVGFAQQRCDQPLAEEEGKFLIVARDIALALQASEG